MEKPVWPGRPDSEDKDIIVIHFNCLGIPPKVGDSLLVGNLPDDAIISEVVKEELVTSY